MPDGEVRPLTLTRLSSEIARSLAPIGRVAVPGEISGTPNVYSSGAYFSLKDRQFTVPVHVPRKNLNRCHLVGGERVQVVGALTWQPGNGRLQLLAEEVVPVGEGAVAAMIEAARQSLAADGLLDRPRRRVPILPALVGVVCGSDAAVRHDIASVIAERFPGLPVRYQECVVTGPGAAANIVGALDALLADPLVEVVILARGGGDPAQLLPWSDEELCRAVAAAAVPVVAAIGHEEDRPLVDEVADVRCGTPSIAAARVVPVVSELRGSIDRAVVGAADRVAALVRAAERRLAGADVRRSLDAGVVVAARRLERAGDRLDATHPSRALALARARVGQCDADRPLRVRLDGATARLAAAGDRLADLGPGQVLRRGYAVVRAADGAVVRDAADLGIGDRITVDVAVGRFSAVVTEG